MPGKWGLQYSPPRAADQTGGLTCGQIASSILRNICKTLRHGGLGTPHYSGFLAIVPHKPNILEWTTASRGGPLEVQCGLS